MSLYGVRTFCGEYSATAVRSATVASGRYLGGSIPRTSRGKDLERSQRAIPGNLSDNSISSRARPRNLFTALIMVFCRLRRRFSCFCGAVNGLTTNRQDLHRITNAFTTNLFVCDQFTSDGPSLSPASLSQYLSASLCLSPSICLFVVLP